MPFVVAGDPNFKKSLEVIKQLAKTSDLLELGFPYSDPLADGPTIQAANSRAIKSGINTHKVFELVKQIRKFSQIPITVLVYANLVYQQGINNFYKKAKTAGIDGVLIPDVPVEESEIFVKAAVANNILPIFLVSQTTTTQRLKKILKVAQGFLYLVSVLGVTGKRKVLSKHILNLIKKVKSQTKLPVAIGFGISAPEQITQLKKAGADGVIVGSALIDILAKSKNIAKAKTKIEAYTKKLRGAL